MNAARSVTTAANGDSFTRRRPMRVHVRLPGGKSTEWSAEYFHRFDAYDDAMERFGLRAERVEVSEPGAEQRGAT